MKKELRKNRINKINVKLIFMKITIKVIPRSSQNEVIGYLADGILKIKLTSAPVDGQANIALIELLSKYFSVAKSSITILKGKTNKIKVIEIKKITHLSS